MNESEVINNKITINEKESIKRKLGVAKKKIVLVVSKVNKNKGIDTLLKAVHLFDNSLIDFFIIGDNSDKLFENLVLNLNINNVHFLGFKSKKELSLYYQISDLFVLPTREDIWGLVINEAMSFALPIITTNKCVAGLELVKHNINGLIIESDNEHSLAEAINLLINDDTKLKVFGENSLRIISDYTIEKMVKKHYEFLKNVKL
jgi:glycosyltransferase involved in cell wall biosynthesis